MSEDMREEVRRAAMYVGDVWRARFTNDLHMVLWVGPTDRYDGATSYRCLLARLSDRGQPTEDTFWDWQDRIMDRWQFAYSAPEMVPATGGDAR